MIFMEENMAKSFDDLKKKVEEIEAKYAGVGENKTATVPEGNAEHMK
jgi:hypothetical protein